MMKQKVIVFENDKLPLDLECMILWNNTFKTREKFVLTSIS